MTINSTFTKVLFSILIAGLSFLGNVAVVIAGTNEAGLAFLNEKKNEDGVIALPSGLMYKVLKKGRGPAHPAVNAPCSCHYEGKLIDGTIFDSSYERGSPTSFAPNQVIKGWTEAMQLMVVGDKWEMYIPSELGYGDRGSPPKIGGGDALIFKMEMLTIEGDSIPARPRCMINFGDEPDPEVCSEKEIKYIAKVTGWAGTKMTDVQGWPGKLKIITELKRLQGILSKPMKDELRYWVQQRFKILEQFVQLIEKDVDEESDKTGGDNEL